MQDGEYTKHNTALRAVGLIALLGVLVWLGMMLVARHADKAAYVPVDATLPSDEYLYSNDEYGLSLRYDDRFVVLAADEMPQSWRYTTTTAGTRLFAIQLPASFMPHTNFSEATIVVGVSTDPEAIKSCSTAVNGEQLVAADDAVSLPGFKVFSVTDAGAGNFYEGEDYRAIKKGACLSIERTVHSTNIGNYDPSQGITEFDRSALDEVLGRVMESVHLDY